MDSSTDKATSAKVDGQTSTVTGASCAGPAPRTTGWVMLVCGAIALLASFMLTMESFHYLEDPSASLVCDINVLVTCQPAMNSSAGSLFGFPNVIVGLISFTLVIVAGALEVGGTRLPVWFYRGLQCGLIVATGMITYFQWFIGFQLKALCIWCTIIWIATIPLVVLVTIANMAHGRLGPAAVTAGRRLTPWAWVIIVVWYIAVTGLVLSGMWQTIRLSML